MSEVQHNRKQGRLPSKKFAALLYIPLTIPGIIPLYYALQQDDMAVALVMAVTGVGVLALNALLLVVLYRWFERTQSETGTTSDEG
jgi:hypothetical protein